MIKPGALALSLAGLFHVCAPGAARAAASDRFDFNTYEFSTQGQDAYGQVPNTIMVARAQAFVAEHYPAGGSARAAVRDFQHAGAVCHTDQRSAEHTVCSYVLPSHGVTGLLGSALWRIDIHSAPQADQLIAITISRTLAVD
ncbi:MAG: hypothetical protein ACYDD1_01925 [Caulobacteraceae bacterium]